MARDRENTSPINSSNKIQLELSSVGNRSSSPAMMHPYFQRNSAPNMLQGPAQRRAAKADKTVAQIRDELISDLIGPDTRLPPLDYDPLPDELRNRQAGSAPHPDVDTVSIGGREESPRPGPPLPPARRTVRPPKKHKKTGWQGISYSLPLNLIFLAILFGVLHTFLQISGLTGVNALSLYAGLRMEFVPLPLWLNTGGIIIAVILLTRILLYRLRYAVGLIIGLPVSLNTVLSFHIEGFVGNGIIFAFCISALCLLYLAARDRVRIGGAETSFTALVATLGTIPLVAYHIHLFAALFLGAVVGTLTKIILVCHVKLRRSQGPSKNPVKAPSLRTG